MQCSNCGHELAPDAKFCSSCGSPVNADESDGGFTSESDRERERREDFARAWGSSDSENPTEPESEEPPVPYTEESFTGGFADRKPTWELEREQLRNQADDEWTMPSLDDPKPQRKRKWLWVVLAVMGLFVVSCCIFLGWISFTGSGMNWVENLATQAAEEMQRATEAATPQP